MYKEKSCCNCGSIFNPSSGKQKYCVGCKEIVKTQNEKDRWRNKSREYNNYKEHKRRCLGCGGSFVTFYTNKVYCGSEQCNKIRIYRKNHGGSINTVVQYNVNTVVDNYELNIKLRDYFINNFPDLVITYNDRLVIKPKELDIYFPDQKVAVEVCGLYWHSDTANGISRDYHYNKMMLCYNVGVRLITVFEDEVNNKFDLVVSRIKQALGLTQNKLYARNCSVSEIDVKTANEFFDANHIQGKSQSKVAYGLLKDGVLVASCSLGPVTRNNANLGRTLELKRFCCLNDYNIPGAAGRLFKKSLEYANSNNFTNLKSYCDMRYANIFKPVYETLGFDLLTYTKYTPHYFKNGKRFRNMSLRKTPEERLTGKTELRLRVEQGYDRIWDCGHRTYIYNVGG